MHIVRASEEEILNPQRVSLPLNISHCSLHRTFHVLYILSVQNLRSLALRRSQVTCAHANLCIRFATTRKAGFHFCVPATRAYSRPRPARNPNKHLPKPTPGYLISHGRHDEARQVSSALSPTGHVQCGIKLSSLRPPQGCFLLEGILTDSCGAGQVFDEVRE
jgi:hypothetical protein